MEVKRSVVNMTSCTFRENSLRAQYYTSRPTTTPVWGGAVYLTSNSLAHVVDCSFIRNRDEQEVAALGGAISASASTIRLRRVVFEGNEATDGAAIFAADQILLFTNTQEIYNSLLQEEDRQQY